MISAIILAGGNSTRLGGEVPKQFLKINGQTLIDFSISTFKSIGDISEIILVIPKKYKLDFELKYSNLKIVVGGNSRKESSYNGILACSKNTDKVLIHDAARIFVTSNLVKNCINSLNEYDAVTLAIPMMDTIASCQKDMIYKMENRKKIRCIQTPQGFDYRKIKLAHEIFEGEATDDIRIMLDSGYLCKIIDGHEDNFKITTESDYFRAKQKIEGQK